MAFALIKVKIMPESPDTDLDQIEATVKDILTKADSKSIKFEREPIAFGLIAVIVGFSWEDTIDTDPIIEKLQTIDHVNPAEIIDYRRAIG